MKRVLMAALGGMIALGAWSSVVNGMLGVQRSIEMKRLADDRALYEMLAGQVVEPGRYVLNPEVIPGGPFPGKAPVFGIQYSGVGHEDAWQEMAAALASYFLVSLLGALLLFWSADAVRSRFTLRLLFVAGIGMVSAVFRFLGDFGIGSYRLSDAGLLALGDLAAWILAGAVMAGILGPGRGADPVSPGP